MADPGRGRWDGRAARAARRCRLVHLQRLVLDLLGLPFLALVASGQVAVIASVIVVFVVGEMLWMPTSQALAAQLAPAPARGTYFGALTAMTGPAWTLAPFIALQLRERIAVGSVWILFAAIGVAGAGVAVAAVRSADSAGLDGASDPTSGVASSALSQTCSRL